MPSSVSLGNLESTVNRLVASGRYNSKSEVLREGIRLVEEREKRLAALDATIAGGIAEVDSGLGDTLESVTDALTAKYEGMAKARGE